MDRKTEKKFRTRHGITQVRLARVAKVTPAVLSGWGLGYKTLGAATVVRLEKALHKLIKEQAEDAQHILTQGSKEATPAPSLLDAQL